MKCCYPALTTWWNPQTSSWFRRSVLAEEPKTCFLVDVFLGHCNYAMMGNSVMSSFSSKRLLTGMTMRTRLAADEAVFGCCSAYFAFAYDNTSIKIYMNT